MVLLIEDTVALATVFATHLQNDGVDVHTCHLAADALAMLDENRYSLILLDLQLPDQDGLDLLREIRRRGIQTMVIVVTSDASIDRAVEAMRIGAKDYLVKPLEANFVLNKLDVNFLRVLSVFHDYDHFPFSESTIECLRFLNYLYLTR